MAQTNRDFCNRSSIQAIVQITDASTNYRQLLKKTRYNVTGRSISPSTTRYVTLAEADSAGAGCRYRHYEINETRQIHRYPLRSSRGAPARSTASTTRRLRIARALSPKRQAYVRFKK
ncbi:hypothetical protein EVAR_82555_1 [Eumeta japonica]|uniref:Uncharacterized protein n=1 Tax=Eumeta variegata TaxID=151549 RepID=A0A4C1UWE6_EUMVA|nr:hypothetical protein EVAR_82555_1 [Eumeta japonica]